MHLALALVAKTWTLVVGGDIMLNSVPPSAKIFEGIKKFVSSADIATANLEIPLTSTKSPTTRKSAAELKAKTQFVLKADPKQAAWIADAGFDVVGLGNNHAMDFGVAGLKQMTGALDKAGVGWCGAGESLASASAPVILSTKNGIKVAFASFLAFQTEKALWKCTYATEKSSGVSTLLPFLKEAPKSRKSDPLLHATKEIVSKARAQADVVIIWLHWGTERKTVPDPYQYRVGRAFIEAGADCVLGAHPHVLQGAETYSDRPVFYSLGNLISPLPAQTSMFRLTFNGRELQGCEILPCAIKGGRVAPVKAQGMEAASTAFDTLCAQAVAKAPSKKSFPLNSVVTRD